MLSLEEFLIDHPIDRNRVDALKKQMLAEVDDSAGERGGWER